MGCVIALGEAIMHEDDSLRSSYLGNVKMMVSFADMLMTLQINWTNTLETDRTNAVEASMQPGGGAAAMASAWNMQYQEDSTNRDIQTGQCQTILQADQTQIGNDMDARKANFSLAKGANGLLATINNLAVDIGNKT